MGDEKEYVRKKIFWRRFLGIRLVHWDAKVLGHVARDALKDGRYNYDFYGIGVGGHYLGFFHTRLKK